MAINDLYIDQIRINVAAECFAFNDNPDSQSNLAGNIGLNIF